MQCQMQEKSRRLVAGFFRLSAVLLFLKKLQLLSGGVGWHLFLCHKEFDFGELLVGDGEAAHLSVLGQGCLDALEVHGGIFAAGAVAHVDGELEHGEAVAQQVFAEVGGSLAFPFGLGG